MRSIYRSLALTLLAALFGCEHELAGAPCPCLPGWQCCEAQNVCVPAQASCPASPTGAGELPLLITSARDAYWKTDSAITKVSTDAVNVTVNDAALSQTWEGFGGALNELGWKYLSMLAPEDLELALHLLFARDGAHFNLGRIPMGANDYAIARYTLDEVENDTALESFSISPDMEGIVPYAKAALAVNPELRFWSNPWTPPTWMKQSPFQMNWTTGEPSAFDGGSMKSDAETLAAYARYFVKFVQQYAEQGIEIATVAPQNEPSQGDNYPSCTWDKDIFSQFIGQHLGPALADAKLDTRIMLGTMSDASADSAIMDSVLADAKAKSYVRLIGLQWGMLSNMAAAQASGLPLWQTEHMAGNCPFPSARCATITPRGQSTAAPNDDAYAIESWNNIHDWIQAGVSSYNAWNLVLDTLGVGIKSSGVWNQNALLVVDTAEKKLIATPAYWVFRHVSQFVEPGARVVATTGGSALAFRNPNGTLATILFNAGPRKEVVVAALGKKYSFEMPASGWATLVVE